MKDVILIKKSIQSSEDERWESVCKVALDEGSVGFGAKKNAVLGGGGEKILYKKNGPESEPPGENILGNSIEKKVAQK